MSSSNNRRRIYEKLMLAAFLFINSTITLAEDIPGLPLPCAVGVVDNAAFVQSVGRATSTSSDPHSDFAAIDDASREALQLCTAELSQAMVGQSIEAAAFYRTCTFSGVCVASDDDMSHPCQIVPFSIQVTPVTMDLGAQGTVTAFIVSVVAEGVANISNYRCSQREIAEPINY